MWYPTGRYAMNSPPPPRQKKKHVHMRVVLDEAGVFPRVLKRYFMVKHSADPP